MGRPTPPPGEAPLLCEECSKGCGGHRDSCFTACCECPRRRTRIHERLEARWASLANSGRISEDAPLVAAALRVAAGQYDRDAIASRDIERTRQRFVELAVRCRVIAEAIDP